MFYDQYLKLCEQRGEKPTPVAQKLGCSSSNIAMWKKGSTPREKVLQKIADYFNVTTQYLLFGEETVSENKEALSLLAEGNEERAWAKQVIDQMDAVDFEPIAALLKHYADKYKTP